MAAPSPVKTHSNSVFSLSYRLVLTTRGRKKVLTEGMLEQLENIFADQCPKWESELREFKGEADYVEIRFDGHPRLELSRFVNSLKTVTSRLLRRDHAEHLRQHELRDAFWSNSYCLLTCGDPQAVIEAYLENERAFHV